MSPFNTIANEPNVTIGIPTYNRAAMLKRAIESALGQSYESVEVIVYDNASTDDTRKVVENYQHANPRLHYHAWPKNVGSTRNFNAVLSKANGEFFMWLGDDDWIDKDYVLRCVTEFATTPGLALVSGSPRYYRHGHPVSAGKVFDLQHDAWWLRVIGYYARVVDNGMFYGVMRTSQIRPIGLRHAMGNDWHTIASIVGLGKTRSLPDVSVHRELGGASSSPSQIAIALRLPVLQVRFPVLALSFGACWHILRAPPTGPARPVLGRGILGVSVFWIVLIRHVMIYVTAGGRKLRTQLSRLWPLG